MKKNLTIKQILAGMVILVIALGIFVVGNIIYKNHLLYNDAKKTRNLTQLVVAMSNVVHETQKERGATAGFIGSNGGEVFRTKLANQRKNTDAKMSLLLEQVKKVDKSTFETLGGIEITNALTELKKRKQIRKSVDELSISLGEALKYYSNINKLIINSITKKAKLISIPELRDLYVCFTDFANAKEKAGIERAVLSNVISKGEFTPKLFVKFVGLVNGQQTWLESFRIRSPKKYSDLFDKTLKGEAIDIVNRTRKIALTQPEDGDFGISAGEWFDNATKRINKLKIIEDTMFDALLSTSGELKLEAFNSMVKIVIFGILALILTSFVSYKTYKYIMNSIYRLENSAHWLSKEIERGAFNVEFDLSRVSSDFKNVAEGYNRIIKKFKYILDNFPIPFFSIDRNFSMQYSNLALQKFVKKNGDEVLGLKCTGLVKADACTEKTCAIGKAMEMNIMTKSETHGIFAGKDHYFDYYGLPLANSNGEVLGAVDILVDKTGNVTQADIEKDVALYTKNEIAKLLETLNTLASGDLRVEYLVAIKNEHTKETEEQFKKVEGSLKSFVDNWKEVIRSINKGIQLLNNSASSSSNIASQLVSSFQSMGDQAQGVSAASEEVSVNVNTVASAAEEINVNTETISTGTESMSQNMESVTKAIDTMTTSFTGIMNDSNTAHSVAINAVEISRETSLTMKELGEASDAIGKVTTVIKRIAEQTNLLALNATIEAASAGEAGKGFSVVANEIKELASQSGRAAEDIANKVSGIQTRSNTAIGAIDNINSIINEINTSITNISSSVDAQSLAIDEMNFKVDETNNNVQEIIVNIGEIVEGTREVSKNIGEVSVGANETSYSIGEISNNLTKNGTQIVDISIGANKLSELAKQLDKQISHFQM